MSIRTSEQVLTTANDAQWRSTLEEFDLYDFYHLPSFHRLAESRGEGEAVMPVFRSGGYVMAFPMLLRDIVTPAQTKLDCKDATSINGFAGPLTSSRDLPDDVRRGFLNALDDFFAQSRIIAAYSRLHPITCDPDLMWGYGQTVDIGFMLSIDLTIPPEAQWRNYRRDHRKVIGRLRRNGYTCREVGVERLDEIHAIYLQTMRRVGADPAFLFDKAYFEYLLTQIPEAIHVYSCSRDGTMAAFTLFSTCGGIVTGYLSGTEDAYVAEAPSRIIYDDMRLLGNEIGAKIFHLGGGVGGRRDALYDFKKGFATHEHVYRTWRHVVDQRSYDEVCREMIGCAPDESDMQFFPAYRDPELQERTIYPLALEGERTIYPLSRGRGSG